MNKKSICCFLRPLREKVAEGRMRGFTLIELLVVVIIIAILAAIAVPQYKKAVLKSRFSTMMPMAKSIADAQEVYYQGRQMYALSTDELDVTPVTAENTTASLSTAEEEGEYAYVAAQRSDLPDLRYLVFQKHSPKFASTTMCEARDEEAGKVCLALGGTDLGGGVTNGWTAYLLSGDATGSNFCPTGATCDADGNITECPSGKTPKEGKCTACDIPNASTCSTTSYEIAECNAGYRLKGSVCEEIPMCGGVEQPADETKGCGKNYTGGKKTRTASCVNNSWSFGNTWDTTACEADPDLLAQLQALAIQKCSGGFGVTCMVVDGTVKKCETGGNTVTSDGECIWNGAGNAADEFVYNPDGTTKERYYCPYVDSGHCYSAGHQTYDANGTYTTYRQCADKSALGKDLICANGYNTTGQENYDTIWDSDGRTTVRNYCSAVNAQGVCTAYSSMERWEYPNETGYDGVKRYTCTDIKPNSTECRAWTES